MLSITMRIELKSAYRWLWLKKVGAFDPKVHCAKCLVGEFDNSFIPKMNRRAGDVYEGALQLSLRRPLAYLCGVLPAWHDNLHVAMHARDGSSFTYEDAHVIVEAHGAARIPILPLEQQPGVDVRTLELPKDFRTCRNYQFGHQAYLDRMIPLHK